MGLGWKNAFGAGIGVCTTTSGIEGAWKPHPTRWDMGYFDMLFGYEWECVKSPAGAWQWLAKDVRDDDMVPDAHDPASQAPSDDDHGRSVASLRSRVRADLASLPCRSQAFADAFARAWFKLTHRDMGPRARYLGPEVPAEELHLAGPGSAGDPYPDRTPPRSRR